MREAADFREESRALWTLLDPIDEGVFDTCTLFKGWTVGDVIGHLHMGNHMAELTLARPDEFAEVSAWRRKLRETTSLIEAQDVWLDGLAGKALLEEWLKGVERTADLYEKADPKQRVRWAGPDMSARSSITARMMETWAHGQEVYDVLGQEREDGDRIRSIAHLGVITYGWTFRNRGEDPPGATPEVHLTAPSGEQWTWTGERHDPLARIEGRATDFCQVVAQTRNIGDTALKVSGPSAEAWMSKAQCFAGPPNDPPDPGSRHKQTRRSAAG